MWFRKGLVLGLFALAQIVLAGEDYYKVWASCFRVSGINSSSTQQIADKMVTK